MRSRLQEKLWDYEAVEIGQEGPPTVVTLTAEHIEAYARVAQNPDPQYSAQGGHADYGGALVAMPTMVLTYAPLLREEIAERNGFVALEESRTARRQTPFAKCEVRWFGPVHVGDTLTGTRRVFEKYERRGSRFVTFRVDASNQRSERIAEYDYTCIFSYAGGQRASPAAAASAEPSTRIVEPNAITSHGKPRRTFDSIAVGHALMPLAVSESQQIMISKNELRLAGKPKPSNIHTDEAFARQNIFGGIVNSGPATMSYVDQMLQRSFGVRALYDGGRLLMRGISPFRAGDTVTFSGEVTAKRIVGDRNLVDCRVRGTNERSELVCLCDSTVVLPG